MATMPKTKSVSAWASFMKKEDLSFDDVIKRTSNSLMKDWLRFNKDKIENQFTKETATATFVTPAEFVEEAEDDEAPVGGVKI